MSLTNFLKRTDVKKKFKEEFNKPRFKYSKEIIAEPQTKNFSVIGIAFDYLARFHIEYVNKDNKIISRPWISENYLNRSFLFEGKEDLYRNLINEVKTEKDNFLLNGPDSLDKNLLEPLFKMSRIDVIFRSGYSDIDVFDEVNPKDIEDLLNLYKEFIKHDWKAKEICFLNPAFNNASVMVGGADADVIIDNVLIDFKATKSAGMKRNDFDQLMGYYLLNEVDGIMGYNQKHTINKISIYSARYGESMIIDIKDVFNKERLPEIISWFYITSKEYLKRIDS